MEGFLAFTHRWCTAVAASPEDPSANGDGLAHPEAEQVGTRLSGSGLPVLWCLGRTDHPCFEFVRVLSQDCGSHRELRALGAREA